METSTQTNRIPPGAPGNIHLVNFYACVGHNNVKNSKAGAKEIVHWLRTCSVVKGTSPLEDPTSITSTLSGDSELFVTLAPDQSLCGHLLSRV